jgi:hypothetical protein
LDGRDAVATVDTMADESYVNHVPVMTGGRGRDGLLEFYGRHFIPQMPADARITAVCRTVGQGRLVDEMIFSFTHDIEMDWMGRLPGRGRASPGGGACGPGRGARGVARVRTLKPPRNERGL